jgi:hypothetical protein
LCRLHFLIDYLACIPIASALDRVSRTFHRVNSFPWLSRRAPPTPASCSILSLQMLTAVRAAAPAASRRSFATLASRDAYKVVVVGGGSAGITVAAKLSNSPGFSGAKDVCIVEPATTHYYQPLWTLVGAGIKPMTDSARPESDVIPHGVGTFCGLAMKVSLEDFDVAHGFFSGETGLRRDTGGFWYKTLTKWDLSIV